MAMERSSCNERGFSLIETVISIGLLMSVALGVAQLFAVATSGNHAAKVQTSTSVLAAQKMEQLRSLTWGFDENGLGLPVSDTTTDVSREPATSSGRGLNPSPAGTLNGNTSGYVDYLDVFGNWVGTGTTPPPGAVYIRRWSIEPLPTNPNNTLVFQVLVTTVQRESMVTGNNPRRRRLNDSWIVSVKTRKAS